MFNIGTKEIIIIAVVVLLLFGGKKIPELTKGVVDSVKQITGAFKDEDETPKKDDEPKKKK